VCGIIGYTGKRHAVPLIIDGLRRLEYRGYDSAGVAFLSGSGITIKRCKGKIRDLDMLFDGDAVEATTAIGHTRWATHGRPSEENAHPHRSGGVVLVHNGIIENYLQLKRELQSDGFEFVSETDTEVLCHLIEKHAKGRALEDAVRMAVRAVRGAYAIAVMSEGEPGKIVAVRKDSPLVAGVSEGEYFVASDIPAFLSHSRRVVFLDDDEVAVLTPREISFSTISGESLSKESVVIPWNASMAEKGGYKHFMLKEIFEQPRAIADTLTGRINRAHGNVILEEFGLTESALRAVEKIFIVACGTSWHAAIVGKYMIEKLAKVPVEVDIASEFRYREPIMSREGLFISITQSGETADTLAAQRMVQTYGMTVLTVCNVIGSTASREADAVFYTRSGPEIGVASTKAFTAQTVGLLLFALALGNAKGVLEEKHSRTLIEELSMLPDRIDKILSKDRAIERIAYELHNQRAFLFLARGINYPIALEGALKLKEISYIHAEGYPAGEMKHGPIALIDNGYPVIFLAPADALHEKIVSNMLEVKSRGASIIMIATDAEREEDGLADFLMRVPSAHPLLQPVLFAVPLQLFAYHVGVMRGCDVDQPRNLAKSVTVE
jgi:glucosamine--fructose-6-phosphate aminotransferase (isomerizing)